MIEFVTSRKASCRLRNSEEKKRALHGQGCKLTVEPGHSVAKGEQVDDVRCGHIQVVAHSVSARSLDNGAFVCFSVAQKTSFLPHRHTHSKSLVVRQSIERGRGQPSL